MQSALSRPICQLDGWLGVRPVTLTREGQTFLAIASENDLKPQRNLQQAAPAKLTRISNASRRAEEELLDDGFTLIVALQKRDGS